jgi:hypothetical protein
VANARAMPQPAAPAAHEVLLELLACGLNWAEARALPLEDVACLLHVSAHRRELAALDAEAARIASLPWDDAQEQQRLLLKLRHQAAAAIARFHSG